MVSGASGAARSQKAQYWKGPNTIGTRDRAWQKRQKRRRDIQRRTRRSASTIGGAAPDTIIRRAAADRAGARPYLATRCENASKCATPDRAAGPLSTQPSGPRPVGCFSRRERSAHIWIHTGRTSNAEKQPTDPATAGRHHHYMRDGTLGLLRRDAVYTTGVAAPTLDYPVQLTIILDSSGS